MVSDKEVFFMLLLRTHVYCRVH